MKSNSTKSPVLETEIKLSYTEGRYAWYCKNIAKLVLSVLAVLSCSVIDFALLVSALWVVNHNSLKLEGISSISTSVHDNCFCKARQKLIDCICYHCYAYSQQSYQTGLKEHNILNGIILRNILIPVKFFKALKILFPYLRIESFGDTANIIQARNYIRIIKAFPEKRCAIWSKNIAIWEKAFTLEGGKPKNTTYVHSSSKVNVPDVIDLNRYNFVDHIFTVYDKKYVKENNININCGGKKCLECIKAKKNCYFRNTTLFINEELK